MLAVSTSQSSSTTSVREDRTTPMDENVSDPDTPPNLLATPGGPGGHLDPPAVRHPCRVARCQTSLMAQELLGLRTVIYPAPDLAAARAWWTEFLGYGPYFDQPFYVGFEVAGYELGLLPDADVADGAQTYWGVEDVQAAVDASVEQAAHVHSPPTDVGEGIVTASVRLPDGTLVGFIRNPNFSLG